MTGATLCSGIGAPEAAAPEIHWLWGAEIDAFASRVHSIRHGSPNLGDITAEDFIFRAEEYPRPDVLVAGTPCQAFSVAGLRNSLADERGNLTLEFVRIVHAVRPLLVVWENVPGVLSTVDNAFGCFLGALVSGDEALVPVERWTDAGVASGPLGTAAWRILDAQYFGLAQRRRRVFVVFSPFSECAPEILFEWESLRRDSAPRREAGKGTSGAAADRARAGGIRETSAALTGSGRGVQRAGESRGQDCVIPAFQNTGQGWWNESPVAAPIRTPKGSRSMEATVVASDVARCLNAGAQGRIDWETETFVPVAIAERTRGDGPALEAQEDLAYALRTPDGGGSMGKVMVPETAHTLRAEADGSEDGIGRGTPLIPVHAIYSTESRCDPLPPDISPPLKIGSDSGENPPAVTVALSSKYKGREGIGLDFTPPLMVGNENQPPAVTGTGCAAVRKLMPVECERLQGFPDGFTAIPGASDAQRYKALGNSMAVPVLRWILGRIRNYIETGSADGETRSADSMHLNSGAVSPQFDRNLGAISEGPLLKANRGERGGGLLRV